MPAHPSEFDEPMLRRLEEEMDAYTQWMKERAEEVYMIAERARSLGLDPQDVVEIPRASDLASRTEKLLVEHLEGMEVASSIRDALAEHDRETTAIMIARETALRFRDEGYDLQRCIDVGLRVGLAILTEAVLVAPLEGISEVRLLSNMDGSTFLSVHFTGPIRAAGGTAQALAVLIADTIRSEFDIGRYVPTDPEVERVKEEFGLYRGNLQYRPTPEEIDVIVRACPIMINGESTETIECAGYGRVRNIDEPRIRGGVLLVIGEGMVLKAPKIQKHTERLNVPGWDFISEFSKKGSTNEGDGSSFGEHRFHSQRVQPITKFMQDIIAGRPIFGMPLAPGGFRLRYGRPRVSGLAAASIAPATMVVVDDFLTVGTQMKIERPGKACAVTPCDEAEGPMVLLKNGRFLRLDSMEAALQHRPDIAQIWDLGEIVLGFGEFMENNKHLVPAGYGMDWWASDLLESLDDEIRVDHLCSLLGIERSSTPSGLPTRDMARVTRVGWHRWLRTLDLSWGQATSIAESFGTAIPPPHNLAWLDLPIAWVPGLVDALMSGRHEGDALRIHDVVDTWSSKTLMTFTDDHDSSSSAEVGPVDPLNPDSGRREVEEHGIVKSALMLLGCTHHHDGADLLVTEGWEALLNGLGMVLEGSRPLLVRDPRPLVTDRLDRSREASGILAAESERTRVLSERRATRRIAAETEARQRGASIADTDRIGREAAADIPDEGPDDAEALLRAQRFEDEHHLLGSLWLVRRISDLRWEHVAPVRIGARMGRPEKAAPREMKGKPHTLFPIGIHGGAQRRMDVAMGHGSIRITAGERICGTCDRTTPFVRCHHRILHPGRESMPGEVCGGVAQFRSEHVEGRRRGRPMTVALTELLEDAQIRLGLDRLPKIMKAVKGLMSKDQTPEPIEKGYLRAMHEVPVFRDGTIRFDMSDVPITHFTPKEIGADVTKLVALGYERDVDGMPLEHEEQMLEIFPQDFILSRSAGTFLTRVAAFVDDLLVRFYGMDPFYSVERSEDLIGHLIVALAPHTSGGVLSRIIGFSDSSGGYAHPLFHAAKRRNCDGDEDAVMLLMDGLLNFSRSILPSNRGGLMDAPLVLTTRLDPTEVDKEALNVDASWYYDRGFYESTLSGPHPKDVIDRMDIVEGRLGSVTAVRGYGYLLETDRLDRGPALSAYKTLETMKDKMNGQLALGHRLRGVDVRVVASSVIRSHFLPDLRGNLVAFTRQKTRCMTCGESYRRMPLSGKCIAVDKDRRRSIGGQSDLGLGRSSDQCGGNLALTVTEGAVRKYIPVTQHVMETYGVDGYTQQNIEWLSKSADSLFHNDRERQLSLDAFL